MKMKNYKNAITSFSKAIALHPDYDYAYLQRAYAYQSFRNYRKALEDCNQVINTKDFSSVPFNAYLTKGTVFIYLNKCERALGEFYLARKLKPDFFLVHTCCAEAYCYLGKYEQGLESIQQALKLNRDFDINYLWRGWANYGLSKFEEALEDCNYYIQNDKDPSPKAFEVRGLIYKAGNVFDRALEDLEKAASLYKKEQLHTFYEEVCHHIREIREQKLETKTTSPEQISSDNSD
jgi:tetratricopeptide (TPR) repeat protein